MRAGVFIAFLLTSLWVSAQSIITGVVTDNAGEPLNAVTVKAVNGKRMLAYKMTNAKGEYQLKVTTNLEKFGLVFQRLGFANDTVTVDNKSQKVDATLSPKETQLKEVVVKAPEVTLRGDTLSFLLSAFVGKGDVTLKDALKKIPGIKIERNGTIRYQGKKISNFYIEGLDMLGGRYNIATNNIPASYVSQVQILNNHQPVKSDKTFSDNVAMNIKLSEKAKLKPMGTYEAKGGYGDDWLYMLGGAGMMFTPKFQTILTAKIGNIKEFSRDESGIMINVDRMPKDPLAKDVIGELTTSSPPISRDRYISPVDGSVTLNSVFKVGKDKTLRANVGYSYAKEDYDLSTSRSYFDGASTVNIDEEQQPGAKSHNPTLSLQYMENSEKRYVTNLFNSEATFLHSELPTITEGVRIGQSERMKDFNVRNKFYTHFKAGKVTWSINSSVMFTAAPSAHISVEEESGTHASLSQEARSYRFFTNEEIQGAIDIKDSQIGFPISFSHTSDRIRSDLDYGEQQSRNRLNGDVFKLNFSPDYSYTHPLRKVMVHLSLDMQLLHYNYRNTGTVPVADKGPEFTVNPRVYFNVQLNARSNFRFDSSFSRSIGDILDFMTAPVRTDYLSESARSGILAHNKRVSGSLHYDYKLPLKLWFFHADVSAARSWRNLMNGQDVSQDLISGVSMLRDNRSDAFNVAAGLSKQFRKIQTTISLDATYNWSRNAIYQAGEVVDYYGQGFTISPSINARPWKFIEFEYNGNISKTFSRYLSVRQNYMTQSHRLSLSAFPVDNVQLKVSSDITHRDISENQTKTMTLFDAGVWYSFKPFRIGLSVDNILNQKHYSYTVFNGLDRFSYDYRLRGRQFVVSLSFTK